MMSRKTRKRYRWKRLCTVTQREGEKRQKNREPDYIF